MGVNQSLKFPLVYAAQKKVLEADEEMQLYRHRINQRELTLNVLTAYYDVVYFGSVKRHYKSLDSLYTVYARAAKTRQKSGEGNRLDALVARSKKDEVALMLMRASEDKQVAINRLSNLLQSEDDFVVDMDSLPHLQVQEPDFAGHPGLLMQNAAEEVAMKQLNVNKMNWLPDISLGYFQGTNDVENAPIYRGVEVGLAFPLFFGSQNSKVKSARREMEVARMDYRNFEMRLSGQLEALMGENRKYARSLEVFESSGKAQASEMMNVARKSFDAGEISVLEYVTVMDQARKLFLDYLGSLRAYNRTVLEINYLLP